jgi:putative phosphoesterase
MKLGILSDTHDFLDPRIPEFFDGVQHILHAGDIGSAHIIRRLEQIAPVTAVLGNNDIGLGFRALEILDLRDIRFLICHILNPQNLHVEIAHRIRMARPNVVVFGHTHRPFEETIGGVLYLNPGYAGPTRFGMTRSAAVLSWEGKNASVEFKTL